MNGWGGVGRFFPKSRAGLVRRYRYSVPLEVQVVSSFRCNVEFMYVFSSHAGGAGGGGGRHGRLAGWVAGWLAGGLLDCLAGSLAGWFCGLASWLADWLTARLAGSLDLAGSSWLAQAGLLADA